MILEEGQIYQCKNPSCKAEVRVQRESVDGNANLNCCCGAQMECRYDPPRFRRVKPTPELIALLKAKQDE